MVMAAGEGRRLRPLTSVVAKPALPVANEPVMGHLLRRLASQGIRNVIANTCHLSDQMQSVFADGNAWGVDLSWSVETELAGTAGGVKRCDEFLRADGGAFLVLSGDGMHDVDLTALIAEHERTNALVTLALIEVDDPSEYGVVVLDDDGQITKFQEKPAPGTELSRLSNTGIYVCSPEVLDLIPAGEEYDFGTQGFPTWLADGKRLQGLKVDAYWNDIGGHDAYNAGNIAAVDGTFGTAGDDSPYGPNVLVAPTASIGADVQFTGSCIVGPGATIGDGSHLVNAVVLPGATIAAGTYLSAGTTGSLDALAAWANDL